MTNLSIVDHFEGRMPVVKARQPLSERQHEVLYLTSMGMKTGEIAKELEVSTQTIKSARSDIVKLLGKAAYLRAVFKNAP